MKKLLFATLLASLMLVGCKGEDASSAASSSSKEEASVKEESQAVASVESSEEASEAVIEDAENDVEYEEDIIDEIVYTDIETSDGFKVSFMSEAFEKCDYEDDLDNSVTIQCIIDPEHKTENYINLLYTDEYSADDLYEGLKLQGTDINVIESTATIDGIEGKVLQYQVDDTFQLTFFVLPHLNGAYKIEVGSHLYDEADEQLAYEVSGTMEDLVNSIQLEK